MMKKLIIKIIEWHLLRFYSTETNAILKSLNNKNSMEIRLPLFTLKLIYLCYRECFNNQGWMIFLIDKSASITFFDNLDVRLEIKSSRQLTKKHFNFIKQHKQFIPEKINKISFPKFIFSEIISYPIRIIVILILSSLLYFNTSLSLLEKLITANLSIVTIFISIYLVFINIVFTNETESDINTFFSGNFHNKYEDNKNMYYLSLISISTSLIDLIFINIQFDDKNKLIEFFKHMVNRETITLIFTIISIICTYLCLFNIAEYYLKAHKYKIYLKSIDKIIEDQKTIDQSNHFNH